MRFLISLLSLSTVTSGGFCLLFSPSTACAEVKPPRIAQLAENSEMIVVATVKSVSGRADDGNRRAKATVTEVLKGPDVKSVEYRASPDFACDISDAKPGETVLLFLAKDREKEALWCIEWAGYGRMRLSIINDKQYVSYYHEIIFPDKTPSIRTSEDAAGGFGTAVELKIVKELVRRATDQKK